VGWERPDSGSVRWWLEDGGPDSWQQVGIVPQRLGLLEELTVKENVTWPLRLAGVPSRHAHELQRRLGLAGLAARFTDEISLGEQQRAAIARALVLRPRLVVADEPTSHQDEQSAATVLDAFEDAREGGATALIATHDVSIPATADRLIRIVDGRVGSPLERGQGYGAGGMDLPGGLDASPS
jgi:putative ABC transport system ATP-binding protein